MIEIAMIVICFDANLRNCTMYIQIHSNLSFASTIGGFFSRFIHFFVDHRFQWVRIWVTLNLNSFNFNWNVAHFVLNSKNYLIESIWLKGLFMMHSRISIVKCVLCSSLYCHSIDLIAALLHTCFDFFGFTSPI